MSIRSAITKFFSTVSGYDAVTGNGRRKAPAARVLNEDQELRGHQRRVMTTSTRDLQRNFTIAAWMIRKHLDFLTSFKFQANTEDPVLNQQIEDFIAWRSKPMNFDAAGRHSRQSFLRIAEARSTLDGDVLINFLADGRVQGIEGDRIQTENADLTQVPGDPMNIVNGVALNDNGRAIGYCVFRRPFRQIGLLWDRFVPARFSYLLAYFDRFDQVRGISPMAPGINNLRDIYESVDYALAKLKLAELYALAIYRESSDRINDVIPSASEIPETPSVENGPYGDVKLDKGPFILDLDAGDKAEILQDRTPSTESQEFIATVIMIALKALDLPYSFYDESHTNWVGQQQANSQYMLSAANKRQRIVDLLEAWTQWQLGLAVMDGDIKGKLSDFKYLWVPIGVPPVDLLKQITSDLAEVASGLANIDEKAMARNGSMKRNIDALAAVLEYAKSKNVPLSFALPTIESPTEPEAPDVPDAKKKKDAA